MSNKKIIETRLVRMTEYSKTGERRFIVAKSPEDFKTVTGEELKESVNFCDEMLIVAALGPRPSGGYLAIIDEVTEEDGQMFVYVREDFRGGFVTMGQTCPITIIAVKKTDIEVCFTFSKQSNRFD